MKIEKRTLVRNLNYIIIFFCLIGFLILAGSVFKKEVIKIDIIGYEIISNLLLSDFATNVFKIITNLGSAVFLVILTALLFLLIKNKKVGRYITFNLLIIYSINSVLKHILQRPRPNEVRLIEETGYSFPSGHSMVSMAFYGLLIYLIYKNIKNKFLKWSLILFLIILICFIGISRIYLGVHYTSDVIAGFLLSLSYLIIYINIIKKFMLNT